MQQSIRDARQMKLPAFQGPAPLPRPGSQDMALTAFETRRNLNRRHGLQSTSFASLAAAAALVIGFSVLFGMYLALRIWGGAA